MVNQSSTVDGSPIMKRLSSIEDEARMCGPACPPTDNAACKGIDDEGHVDEALPSRHVGEVG